MCCRPPSSSVPPQVPQISEYAVSIERPMKLYADPASTTSLPILLFLAEHDIAIEIVPVLLAKAEQTKPEHTALNPNKCVPVLDDEGFILTECSAILKYLAEKS